MTNALCTLIAIFITGITFAQSDEAYEVCDHKVFTRVEILPDFKNGKAAFEDSLTRYLKSQHAFPEKGNITYQFIVTKQSKVLDIKKVEGDTKYEERIEEALRSIPDLWIPAKQNSHLVCAYVDLIIAFSKDLLKVKVVEPASVELK